MSRQVPPWFLLFGAAVVVLVALLAYRRTGSSPPDATGPQAPVATGPQAAPTAPPDGAVAGPASTTPAPAASAPQITPLGDAQTAIERHAAAFRLEPGSALVLKNASVTNGKHHYRYSQTHLGVPVEGVGLTLGEDETGRIESAFGQPARGLMQAVPVIAPRLSGDEAIMLAMKAWLGADYTRFGPRGQQAILVIHVGESKTRLAYRVTFIADDSPRGTSTSPWIVVDADDGAILARFENSASSSFSGD